MCRPHQVQCQPSCTNSGRDLGFTIVLLLVLGAIISVVGPVVAAISHVLADVIKLAVIGVGSGILLAAMAWVTAHVIRARALNDRPPRIYLTAWHEPARTVRAPQAAQRCLACGGKGRILQTSHHGVFQLRPCPQCQPAQLAR